jgi:hypothetical protein
MANISDTVTKGRTVMVKMNMTMFFQIGKPKPSSDLNAPNGTKIPNTLNVRYKKNLNICGIGRAYGEINGRHTLVNRPIGPNRNP